MQLVLLGALPHLNDLASVCRRILWIFSKTLHTLNYRCFFNFRRVRNVFITVWS